MAEDFRPSRHVLHHSLSQVVLNKKAPISHLWFSGGALIVWFSIVTIA